jgi:phosphonate transport system ATP-binding protein
VSAATAAVAVAAAAAGSTRLALQGLHKTYVAGKPVLRGIDLVFEGAALTAIIGPSGTGKSTLIRCINRLVEPTSGQILLNGVDLVALRGSGLREARSRIGMVFQEYNLVERLTVMENLLTGVLGRTGAWAAWRRRFEPADLAHAWALLERVGLAEFANARADSLSGGQRQRVGIARAVMQNPSLLLADEPTSSLDPKTSVEIMELLHGVAQREAIPVIVNMHDVELARRYATRIVGMSGGAVVYDGDGSGLTDAVLRSIYGGESWIDGA